MRIRKSSSGEMPFLDHLEELRWRIIYSLGALMIGFAIGVATVMKFDIVRLLTAQARPYLRGQTALVVTGFSAGFNLVIQLAFFIGLAVALPVILYQVWAFLAPALHKHERRVVVPVLFVATLLFVAGAAMGYFVVVPLTLRFFTLDIFVGDLETLYTFTDYVNLLTSTCLMLGAAFEVPVLLVLLTTFGIVSPQALGRVRRWAALVIFVLSAMVSPGDSLTTTFAVAVPLYFLYEASVAVSWIILRKKERKRFVEQPDEPAEQYA